MLLLPVLLLPVFLLPALLLAVLLLAVAPFPGGAQAQDVPGAVRVDRLDGQGGAGALPGGAGAIGLLAGWRAPSGRHMAGLSLTLSPGWKTYWRRPGDAGIPPVFDWSGSDNLARVAVHWPRPVAFDQAGMTSLGYGGDVVLPLDITPVDRARPVTLVGTVTLGVCRDICIPVTAHLSGRLDAPGAPDARIRDALDRAPEAIAGAATCTVDPIDDGLRLTVRLPVGWDGVQAVAVEPADPAIWVSQAQVTHEAARLVATVDLVPPSGAPFALDRSALRFTVVAGARAGEMTGCRGG